MKSNFSSRLKFSVSAIAVTAMSITAQTAYAADTDKEVEEIEEIEEIVVTGSRIKRSNINSPTPVSIIGSDAIRFTGNLSLGDLLTEAPQLSSTFTTANSSRYIGTAGGSFLSLRGLGTSRTLVLVDGKRHISSSPGSASVDINTIPTDLVKHVEIITGGASAIYGADAVTGVVNFIMKDDYEGFTVRGQYGHVGEGKHFNYSTSLIAGGNFADDRGNVVFNVEYVKQNAFRQDERSYMNEKWRLVNNPKDTGPKDGISDQIHVENARHNGYTLGGKFALGGKSYMFENNGSFREMKKGTYYGKSECSNCDGFSGVDWGYLQPKLDKTTIASMLNYDITDSVNVFSELKFINTRVESYGSGSFDWRGNPRGALIKRDNAFVSAALGTLMDANSATSISLGRIHNDLGLRQENNSRKTYRIVLGAKGEIFDDMSWEVSYNYGNTARTLLASNNRINSRFYAAIDAVKDANGKTVCRSSLSSGDTGYDAKYDNNPLLSGCIPLDIMGENRGSQAAKDWVNARGIRYDTLSQHVVSGHLTGDVVELPAGTMSFALGAEWRKERSDSNPSQVDQLGITFGNKLLRTSGNFTTKDVFAEITAPLVADSVMMKELSLDAAIRYADYSTSGGNTSWKVGLNWTPIDDIRFRATYSRAVRAPNISELFGPLNQNFFSASDPCYKDALSKIADATKRNNRIKNCKALGIPDPENRIQTKFSSIAGVSGGNPNLEPETAKTWTVGAVFTPTFLEDFSLTVDYWNIDIKDAISGIGASNIKERCVDADTINNLYCKLLTRGGASENHRIIKIQDNDQNIAALTSSGIDLDVRYRLNEEFSFNLVGSYLISYKDFSFQDEPETFDEYAGGAGSPRFVANLTSLYNNGPWKLSYKMRLIGTQLIESALEDYNDAPERNPYKSTGGKLYHNLKVSYTFEESYEIYFGVDNILATNPPVHWSGTGSTSGQYDSKGRFFYGGFVLSF